MDVLFVLILVSVVLAAAFVVACVAAIRGGQYDDMESPRWRMLFDAPPARGESRADAAADGNVERFVENDVNASAPAARRRTPT